MSHITSSIRPVVDVRLDASEQFTTTNHEMLPFTVSGIKLAMDYTDDLKVTFTGFGIKKDGTQSVYLRHFEVHATDLLANEYAGQPGCWGTMTQAFLTKLIGDVIAHWDSMHMSIPTFSTTTGQRDLKVLR